MSKDAAVIIPEYPTTYSYMLQANISPSSSNICDVMVMGGNIGINYQNNAFLTQFMNKIDLSKESCSITNPESWNIICFALQTINHFKLCVRSKF